MPAGSGPSISTTLLITSIATAELAVLQTPLSNWNDNLGNLVSATINYNASAAQTLTVRIRQGVGVTGAVVSTADAIALGAAGVSVQTIQVADNSAFALQGANQAYTVTLQSSIAGPGTVNRALVELETISTVS